MKLGVNIDHIATLREARKINEPDPLEAVFIAKNAGANQITIHLREDRRHMHDNDVCRIVESSPLPVNVESSTNAQIIDYLIELKPHSITLVPENREEVTTEGGLKLTDSLQSVIDKIKKHSIKISLFVDANVENIHKSRDFGVDSIELHTGLFANIFLAMNSNLNRTHNPFHINNPLESYNRVLKDLESCANLALDSGLNVYAGHGLNYQNVSEIVKINAISELNIGHSIIARSVFVGLEQAILDMKHLIKRD